MNCPESGCFTFQFLPISRQEQNGRVIRFAERLAGEGLVCVPEGGVTVVECAISTRVDGDVLKVFWSYCSEVGFIKVPCDNKSCICKTELSCSMQRTDRTRVLHHSSLGLHCRGCPDQISCAAGLISRIQRANGQ